jgi:hypothetical protein
MSFDDGEIKPFQDELKFKSQQDYWFPIDVEEYIKLAKCRVKIIWLGMLFDINTLRGISIVNGTKARACSICSVGEWLNFVESCYSLICVDLSHDWMSIMGRKEHLPEWISKTKEQGDIFVFDENKFIDCVLCTAFDYKSQKRLVVDGLNRARALTIACEEGRIKNMPSVRVVECYGENVDVLYPCDIHQLRDAPKG